MENQLTKEQIDRLFAFVRSKYVHYIDVQFELVDHLASAIEDEVQKDNKLNFENALRKVYARFPVTGFTNFIASKQKSLSNYWWRRYFNAMRTYFKLPKVILTILVFVISFQVGYIFEYTGLLCILFISFIANIYFTVKQHISFKLINGKRGDYLFMDSSFFQLKFSLYAQCLSFIFIRRFFESAPIWYHKEQSDYTLLMIIIAIHAAICTLTFIVAHANYTIFPDILYDEINQKYKHLGIVIKPSLY
jgi:hypothetical protein